jgi:hypothetical protein
VSAPDSSSAGLDAVSELCRLAVVIRRLDCRVHLAGADPGLRELIRLAGLGDVLGACPAEPAPTPRGGDVR